VPRVPQRERQVKHLSLIRKVATEGLREHAPHRCALRFGDDAHRGTTARSENTAKLFQPPWGIWKEHEPEVAEHGVERAIRKWQRLAVHRDGPKLRSASLEWAASSMATEISAPTTSPERPTLESAMAAASPVPVATSSTR